MRVLQYIASTAFVLFLATLFLFAGALARTNVTFPLVSVGPMPLGLRSPATLRLELEKKFETFETAPLFFVFEGEVKEVSPQELGFRFDLDATLSDVPITIPQHPWKFFWKTIAPQYIHPIFSFDRFRVTDALQKKFSTIVLRQDAFFSYDEKKKEMNVVPEQAGFVFEEEKLFQAVSERARTFSKDPIILLARIEEPVVTAQDLMALKEGALLSLPARIDVTAPEGTTGKWNLQFPRDIHLIAWEKQITKPLGNPLYSTPAPLETLRPYFPDEAMNRWLSAWGIEKEIEIQAGKMNIATREDGKILFDGKSNPGKVIARDRLLTSFQEALVKTKEKNPPSFVLPVNEIASEVEIAKDLQGLGIRELIGVGYTTFRGSPPNRIHNINVGVKTYDGLLIPPGSTFSFVDELGPVDAKTGYKPELVIKPEGTIPEYGGGLCQVSTTMYRAALFSGLPIVERSPHSYAVTYYSQVGGHGIDATIYPGARDLKFLNDTPGHILIHSFADQVSATFELYGTKDGREVTMEGPYISNNRGIPADLVIYTDEVPVGQKRVKEKPHAGFDATWYRYVKKGGETVKETIYSRYRSVPAKILMGGEGPSGADPALDAAKQFE